MARIGCTGIPIETLDTPLGQVDVRCAPPNLISARRANLLLQQAFIDKWLARWRSFTCDEEDAAATVAREIAALERHAARVKQDLLGDSD